MCTYTLKGIVRTDLCIYLNEEEYAELEKCIGQINQWIEKIVPSKMTVLKGYVWKLEAQNEGEQSEVEQCTDIFYKKEHAMDQGIKVVNKCDVATEINIVEEWLPIPDEPKFLQQLYLYIIYKLVVL